MAKQKSYRVYVLYRCKEEWGKDRECVALRVEIPNNASDNVIMRRCMDAVRLPYVTLQGCWVGGDTKHMYIYRRSDDKPMYELIREDIVGNKIIPE